ncbi:hypothetical protein BU17DRAFT_92308 [Hysterangium stoloniferum]|nr:hypothetical protein BU17DRAFT_92308 [Hysterangium stoloniferum]
MLDEYLDHPLNLELDSLRAALDKYQAGHAAQVSSLQLQRARLEANDTSARCKSLEADNDRLKHEVAFLRANVEPSHTPRQVTELSLALRHVSDKLSITENNLQERTLELTNAVSDKDHVQAELNIARAERDKLRLTADDGHFRECQLRAQCRAAEEEARMADVVVMEYADLVRSLEFRLSHSNATAATSDSDLDGDAKDDSTAHDIRFLRRTGLTPVDSLTQNRTSLQRLLYEFNAETANLQSEITRLHGEISAVQITLDAEREVSRSEREKLSEALATNERYRTDDTSAGKMVSRYMRFSQSSIDTLQRAVETLKARHAATLYTLTTSSEALSCTVDSERKRALQLRDILDTLTEDISRETFGRRREVLLRMKSLAREERLMENLRGWVRRAEERIPQLSVSLISSRDNLSCVEDVSPLATGFEQILEEARCILRSASHTKDETSGSPLGNILLAEHTCATLALELQKETEKRLLLARKIASELFNSSISALELTDEVDNCSTLISSNTDSSKDQSTQEQDQDHHVVPSEVGTISEEVFAGNCSGENSHAEVEIDNIAAYFPNPIAQSYDDSPSEGLPIFPSDENKLSFSFSSAGGSSIIAQRYDQIQRSFRDCRVSLAQLKAQIASGSLPHRGMSLLQNVTLRLDDYCEDALVELEIRITDEERMVQNFETMLRLPAALKEGQDAATRLEIRAFIDGTLPSVANVQESFKAKLADLQHDIAQVRRVLYEFETAPEPPRTPPIKQHWSSTNLSSPTSFHSPTSTFGSVITAPKANRVSSASFLPLSLRGSQEIEIEDPYTHLGLRIAMPFKASLPGTKVGSPRHPSTLPVRDTRSSSAMYLLGLGGSRSGIFSSPAPLNPSNEGDGYDHASAKGPSDIE